MKLNWRTQKLKKYYIFIILFISSMNPVFSQKSADFEPYGYFDTEITNEVEFDYSNVKTLSNETNSQDNKMGLTFAHQFTTDLTPDNSGTWETKENGDKVWYLEISSPDAYTINLIFDRYNLPDGAKLFIYNEDMSQVIGAFTSANNNKNGILATAPVTGDKVIVEYQEPEDVDFSGELMIGAVNHDFLGVNKYISQLKSTGFTGSDDCEEDVSCYDTNDTIDVRRAALKLIIDGTGLCSATLINNTNEDGTPYVISGAHCFADDETAQTSVVYFNYESPHCSTDQIDGVKTLTLSGANMVVYAPDLDIALIKMNDTPDESYRPYYAGWSLNTSPQGPNYCFHHPEGDVKKISISNSDVEEASVIFSNTIYAQVEDVHWLVAQWDLGVTEGGSSGSALFDSDFHLIGTLTGGNASCSDPTYDYFTRFCKDWDLRSEDTAQFKVWLDPTNSGTDYLDGYDPYAESGLVRISNVEETDSAGIVWYSNGGYISGHNAAGIELFAEEYEGMESATLKGVYISPCKSTSGSDQTIDIKVWEGSSSPNSLVYTQSGVSLSQLTTNKEAYIPFDEEVSVSGTFFVGYNIDYSGSPIDSFAVYQNTSNSEKENNTMFVNDGSDWQLASDYYSIGNTSLWLDLLAKSVSYIATDSQSLSEDVSEKLVVHPNPVQQGTSHVYLDTNGNYVTLCNLYQMDGTLLQKGEINKNDDDIVLPFNLSELPTGTYLLKFKLKDGSVVVKKIAKL